MLLEPDPDPKAGPLVVPSRRWVCGLEIVCGLLALVPEPLISDAPVRKAVCGLEVLVRVVLLVWMAPPVVLMLPLAVTVPATLMPLAVTSRYLVAPVLFWTPNKVPPIGVELSLIKTPFLVESKPMVSSAWLEPLA